MAEKSTHPTVKSFLLENKFFEIGAFPLGKFIFRILMCSILKFMKMQLVNSRSSEHKNKCCANGYFYYEI